MKMGRTFSTRSRQAGFTLIEMLIAIAVGAIVLLVINTTFFSAFRLRETTHSAIDYDLTIQRALGIVRRDLEGIMIPPVAPTTNTTTRTTTTTTVTTIVGPLSTESNSETDLDTNGGERITPDFSTNSGKIDGWSQYADVQTVAYYLVSTNDGTKNLVRFATRNLLTPGDEGSTGESQVILNNVISAYVSYYDGTNWADTWDSTTTNTLPGALKFSMVVAPRGGGYRGADPAPVEIVVPVLVKTTQSATDDANAAAGS